MPLLSTSSPYSRTLAPLLRLALITLPFLALLAWSWRLLDLAHTLPGYGDVLESLWAIEWYRQSLFEQHALPLFNPNVFYPNGWHSATWANGMLLYFVSATLAQLIGSAPLAFNVMVLASIVVSYFGGVALLRRQGSLTASVIGALLFTFWEFHWLRNGGHPQVAWCIGLLPWFVLNLEELFDFSAPSLLPTSAKKETTSVNLPLSPGPAVRAGLMWGLMMQATLYGIFWGGLVFAVFLAVFAKRWLAQPKTFVGPGLVIAVAGLVAAPLVILYVQGIRADQTLNLGLMNNRHWSASLNTLFLPNTVSPFFWLRDLTHFVYSERIDETSLANLGLLTWLLAGAGAWLGWRSQRTRRAALMYGLIILVCTLLSLGPLLVWDGRAVQTTWFRPINAALWQIGHWVRPDQFPTPSPDPTFASGVPLPGYLFYALVPFSESARVLSRYMLVAMLGCVMLITLFLSRLKTWLQILLGCLMLVESVPFPFSGVPVPAKPHAAYEWIRQQPVENTGAVIEIWDTGFIPYGGEPIFATTTYQRSTLNGLGSFPPKHTAELQTYLRSLPNLFESPAFATALAQYGTRFVVLHVTLPDSKAWEQMQRNPLLRPNQCYPPDPATIAWRNALCVAEINLPAPQARNLILESGWGSPEDWGVWATTPQSQAQFLSSRQQSHQLHLNAFPVCIKGQPQRIIITINDAPLSTHTWRDCEVWQEVLQIPSNLVRVGVNRITFSSTLTASPHDADPANPDRRALSMGFSTLRIVAP